jgi:hypothetical protein
MNAVTQGISWSDACRKRIVMIVCTYRMVKPGYVYKAQDKEQDSDDIVQ